MRQAGVRSRPGTLEQGPQKLAADANAKFLAEDWRDSRFQDRSAGADEHHHLRHHRDWKNFWGNFVRAGGPQRASDGVGADLLRFVTHLDVNHEGVYAGADKVESLRR
jgi:hypothetical protein